MKDQTISFPHFYPLWQKIAPAVLLSVYALFTLTVALFHEPWADELQAWLIARDTSLPELFMLMRYEGHFMLWYLLIRPFAATGCPVLCMSLTAWGLTVLAAWIFVKKAPFGLWMKTAVLCSSGMLFWYPVVARCYAVIPPLLFLLAALYHDRRKYPLLYGLLIAVMANSHAYMEGFCGILFVFLAIDRQNEKDPAVRKKQLSGLLIAAAGALIAFVQVAPAVFIAESVGCQRKWPTTLSVLERFAVPLSDFAGCTQEAANQTHPVLPFLYLALLAGVIGWLWRIRKSRAVILYVVSGIALSLIFYFALPNLRWFDGTIFFFNCVFLPLFILAVLAIFQLNRRAGWILLASFLWQYFFAAFLFYFLPQRALLIFLIYVFCAWIIRAENAEAELPRDTPFWRNCSLNAIFLLYTLFTIPGAVTLTSYDLIYPFSGVRDAGRWIDENIPAGAAVLIPNYGITQSVLSAYAPRHKLYCVESGTVVTYCPLNRTSLDQYPNFKDSPHWATFMEELPSPHYFVCDARFFGSFPLYHMDFQIGNDHFDEIFRTDQIHFASVAGEQFWIFTDDPGYFQREWKKMKKK